MSSDKSYVEYVLELLSGLDEISVRAMMGEYLLYYKQKVIGGIYDNRFLLKPTEAGKQFFPNAEYVLPYEGSKTEMLVVDTDDRKLLEDLINAMYEELPMPKKKSKKA